MSNPGGCPPCGPYTETRMPGGMQDGKPLPDIVIKTCNRCGATS